MNNLLLVLLLFVCSQCNVNRATEYIPCGLTRCYNVGYEVCIGPPEARTEADSDCYSCDALAQIEKLNPCDPASKRHGCMKYCTDKALEEQRKTWDQSQEIFTRALQNEQMLRERNHAVIAGLVCLAALIVMMAVAFCMRRENQRNRKQKEERAKSSSTALVPVYSDTQLTTEKTELINETENNISPEQLYKVTDMGTPPVMQPFDSNYTGVTTEARSDPRDNSITYIVYQPGTSGSTELHDGKCHDERLCIVSPQSQDPGKLCTSSSYYKQPT
ncbi:uncharacterized protein LOC127852150 [Dreissena polymorpha]|uniref:Uncharacterized protein n=1 Tax=Dreissena polymorpha TaxID=45954 RepID=A0A9D4CLE9_DREPO|nr:uncharacterized protein LOC127852150 [Dreissena polymorpha]KAH3726809.1 hypothetical protein DPMN_052679 [Dreissena polymorpha]